MKRIVAGVDQTPEKDALVDWIEGFAADTRAHVIVVHVVPRMLLWAISSVQADFMGYLENVRRKLERDIARRLSANGISATLVIRRGDAARELARIARAVDADMIVVGGADHSALHDVMFGGTARRLEHLTAVPVLVVPLNSVVAHATH